MCLILLALHAAPGRPWLLLGNRDEFHARPTAAAAAWDDAPAVIGGRDLEAGGTWLALNRNGRFAAVTNVRDGRGRRGARSRGELVADFVRGDVAPEGYAATVARRRADYGPFNLVVGDRDAAHAASSLRESAWRLEPGVHVFSNGSPEDLWPKSRRLAAAFAQAMRPHESPVPSDGAGHSRDAAADPHPERAKPRADNVENGATLERLLDLLLDTGQPVDEELPDTGVGLALERILAPIFIAGAQYGTRSSTLAYLRDDGGTVLVERRFGPGGMLVGRSRIGD